VPCISGGSVLDTQVWMNVEEEGGELITESTP
jgi:hypothetical protein